MVEESNAPGRTVHDYINIKSGLQAAVTVGSWMLDACAILTEKHSSHRRTRPVAVPPTLCLLCCSPLDARGRGRRHFHNCVHQPQ
jgi:hypothetical protein